MGVDTTTNPTSHTQAQSVIKAQKGGRPRFSHPARERKTTGAKEVLPQFQRIHPDRLFPAQMVPDGGSDEFQAALPPPQPVHPRRPAAPRRRQTGNSLFREYSPPVRAGAPIAPAGSRPGRTARPGSPPQMAALQKDGASVPDGEARGGLRQFIPARINRRTEQDGSLIQIGSKQRRSRQQELFVNGHRLFPHQAVSRRGDHNRVYHNGDIRPASTSCTARTIAGEYSMPVFTARTGKCSRLMRT